MIRRSTWIVLVLFVVVVAFAFFYQRYQGQKAASATPTPGGSTALFPTIDETQIASLRIVDAQGTAVALGRDLSGLWAVTEPVTGQTTDPGLAESGVTQLITLQASNTLSSVQDLTVFGLLKPAYTITMVLNGGVKHTLLVGDATPTGDGYYVKLDDQPLQVVSKNGLDSLVGMVQNPPFATATPLPTGVEVIPPASTPEVVTATP